MRKASNFRWLMKTYRERNNLWTPVEKEYKGVYRLGLKNRVSLIVKRCKINTKEEKVDFTTIT